MASVFMESDAKRRLIRLAVWVAVLGLLLGVVSSLLAATGASAHAVLKSVSPGDGARLGSAPTEVALTFSEPVSARFATVTVTGPDGGSSEAGTPSVEGATVTQALAAGLVSGGYTVAYRVVSEDGHPISGRTTFTLALKTSPDGSTRPPASAATPTPTPAETAGPGATTDQPPATESTGAARESGRGDGLSTRLAMAVAIGALALAVGTTLIAVARRRDQAEGR